MQVVDNGMKSTKSTLSGILVLTPAQYSDARGIFMETYNEHVMADLGLPTRWCQDNLSISKRNVIRGLHYQISRPQGKLVRVVYGVVLDVAVDLRRSSDTFGQHVEIELDAQVGTMLWIPAGFAHGFVALTDEVVFAYKVTDYYCAQGERTILWNDPGLGIGWPITEAQAIISKKDLAGTPFCASETFA